MGRRLIVLWSLVVALGACGGGASSPRTEPGAPPPTSASPSTSEPAPSADPSWSLPPSPEPEPLGRSVARLRVTGDIRTGVDLRLAALDSFTATWCDVPNDCSKAANTLQIMGEELGVLGSHGTSNGLIVTIELQDRFMYVSGEGYTKGECEVAFTTADDRGFAGDIACHNITNGTGLGILTVSVRGTFVATS